MYLAGLRQAVVPLPAMSTLVARSCGSMRNTIASLVTSLDRPRASRLAVVILSALVCVLYLPGLVTLFPLEDDLVTAHRGDDWVVYHRFALSILEGGLTIPVVSGPYFRPSGFAYPYFIALIYTIFGPVSEAVYLVQGFLLLGTIALLYVALGRRLTRVAGVFFLAALAGVLYVDVFRSLTFRLLSENLLFPCTAGMILLVLGGESSGRLGNFVGAGVAGGLCFLARPNVVLYGVAVAAITLLAMTRHAPKWRAQAAAIFLVAFMAVSSLMSVRNFVVTGELSMPVLTQRSDWIVPGGSRRFGDDFQGRAQHAIWEAIRRTAFLLGFPQLYQPTFRVRPHWLLIWIGVALYVRGLWQRRPEVWELLIIALCVSYFVPLFLVGALSSYGIRMVTPGMTLVLILAVRGLDEARQRLAR